MWNRRGGRLLFVAGSWTKPLPCSEAWALYVWMAWHLAALRARIALPATGAPLLGARSKALTGVTSAARTQALTDTYKYLHTLAGSSRTKASCSWRQKSRSMRCAWPRRCVCVSGGGVEMHLAEGMTPGSHAGPQRRIHLLPAAAGGPAHPRAYPDYSLTPTLLACGWLFTFG
jgi:hypothetical protein